MKPTNLDWEAIASGGDANDLEIDDLIARKEDASERLQRHLDRAYDAADGDGRLTQLARGLSKQADKCMGRMLVLRAAADRILLDAIEAGDIDAKVEKAMLDSLETWARRRSLRMKGNAS